MLQVHQAKLSGKKRNHYDISSFPNTALRADTRPHAFRLFLCFPNTDNFSPSGPMAVVVDFRSHVPFPSCPFCLSFQLRGASSFTLLGPGPSFNSQFCHQTYFLFSCLFGKLQSLLLLPLRLTGALQIKRTGGISYWHSYTRLSTQLRKCLLRQGLCLPQLCKLRA